MIYIFEGQGEHNGHKMVKDKWEIDYHNGDPETSYYCLDCHKSLIITDAEATEPAEETERK